MENLNRNQSLLSPQEHELLHDIASNYGQAHLFKFWPDLGEKDAQKKEMASQLFALHRSYPGGLRKYIKNAKLLLERSNQGANPFEGLIPKVPQGVSITLAPFSNEKLENFMEFEKLGQKSVSELSFVIVAGGLGERLGYSGIKLGLPLTLIEKKCFLEYYIESILAIQNHDQDLSNDSKSEKFEIPLAIMTSDDTHLKTKKLLEDNDYFKMSRSQITLIKQEKVPALRNNNAEFAVDEDEFKIITKPHGHGDVHSLLFSSGLTEKWRDDGKKFVCLIQDTNCLVFGALLAAIGVSKKYNLAMNSVTVPRNKGEAVGAICNLVNDKTGDELTMNVEYNQLESLLTQSNSAFKENADEPGPSPFPGNINNLILQLDPYVKTLELSKGSVPEFVNPKYADKERTTFKSPTRLECMMQDFPRHFVQPKVQQVVGKENLNVGYSMFDRCMCYAPAKNNLDDGNAKFKQTGFGETVASCEAAFYDYGATVLRLLGCRVAGDARVVLKKSFGITLDDVRKKFSNPHDVTIHENSVLILGGNVFIEKLDLDGGALKLIAEAKKSKIVVKKLSVKNKGIEFVGSTKESPEEISVRGYDIVCKEIRDITAEKNESLLIE